MADELMLIKHAQGVNADLLRTNHVPGQPDLLMLADRLGLAVWQEIPMNHFTPKTFTYVVQRGMAQQMLAEMALRDFNRPLVMFHGFAKESTGVAERTSAMQTLRDLDRRIDGTRLTGQAMYGSDPTDPTSSPLDVAGYTFYYGVFYGQAAQPGAMRALRLAHQTYPNKPVMILEFGDWVFGNGYEGHQTQIFRNTYPAIAANFDPRAGGYVGSAVWGSLEDYWTDVSGIGVERFGLYRADGTMRPVGVAARTGFGEVTSPSGIISGGADAAAPVPAPSQLALKFAYAVVVPLVLVVVITGMLVRMRRLRSNRARRAEARLDASASAHQIDAVGAGAGRVRAGPVHRRRSRDSHLVRGRRRPGMDARAELHHRHPAAAPSVRRPDRAAADASGRLAGRDPGGGAVGIVSALIGVLTAALVSASYGSRLGGVEVELEPVKAPAPAPTAVEPGKPGVWRESRRRSRRSSDSAA